MSYSVLRLDRVVSLLVLLNHVRFPIVIEKLESACKLTDASLATAMWAKSVSSLEVISVLVTECLQMPTVQLP